MVDLNEAKRAAVLTPTDNIKYKKSFIYKALHLKNGSEKPIVIIDYRPNLILDKTQIICIKNMRLKLKNGPIIEETFIMVPTISGDVFMPLAEAANFAQHLQQLLLKL